jgi:hypothetical protein
MGTAAGASPAALAPLACFCVLLLLGFFKVAFSTLVAGSTVVDNKEGKPMISNLNKSNCFAAAFFDSVHAIWAGVVAVVVP